MCAWLVVGGEGGELFSLSGHDDGFLMETGWRRLCGFACVCIYMCEWMMHMLGRE